MTEQELLKQIESLRKQSGITRSELARKANVTAQTIRNIERGDCNVTIRNLSRIARVLGKEISIN